MLPIFVPRTRAKCIIRSETIKIWSICTGRIPCFDAGAIATGSAMEIMGSGSLMPT
ncbi:MAG TPA: hypothetical protein VNV82_26110 [Bryobacteraceae bacterium]|nr:hypothetical protein [Bryobacteraceae bacterium]